MKLVKYVDLFPFYCHRKLQKRQLNIIVKNPLKLIKHLPWWYALGVTRKQINLVSSHKKELVGRPDDLSLNKE